MVHNNSNKKLLTLTFLKLWNGNKTAYVPKVEHLERKIEMKEAADFIEPQVFLVKHKEC